MQRYHSVAIVPIKKAINTNAIRTYREMNAATQERMTSSQCKNSKKSHARTRILRAHSSNAKPFLLTAPKLPPNEKTPSKKLNSYEKSRSKEDKSTVCSQVLNNPTLSVERYASVVTIDKTYCIAKECGK
jgi:hypothetical protein